MIEVSPLLVVILAISKVISVFSTHFHKAASITLAFHPYTTTCSSPMATDHEILRNNGSLFKDPHHSVASFVDYRSSSHPRTSTYFGRDDPAHSRSRIRKSFLNHPPYFSTDKYLRGRKLTQGISTQLALPRPLIVESSVHLWPHIPSNSCVGAIRSEAQVSESDI